MKLWLIISTDTNRTRLVRKARPTESFFNFFTPPPPIDEEAEIEEDDLEEMEEKLEIDYQIGEDLKEKVRFPSLSCYASNLSFADHSPRGRLLHRQGTRVRGHGRR